MPEPDKSSIFPILPLRDIVVFPHMIVPLFVGREKSVRALEDVMKDDKQILLMTQRNPGDDDPEPDDMYTIGTIGTVLQLLKLPDGTVKVLVEGTQRAKVTGFSENSEFFEATAELITDKDPAPEEHDALARSVISQFEEYIKLNKKIPPEVLVSLNQIEEPGKLADTVASHLALKISEKQELLELKTITERRERA
jgi:ATP-dependent Lon protease